MKDKFLFIDLEGTGFKKGGALQQDGQARACQFGMILTDDVGKTLAKYSAIIMPDNWRISEGAQKVHGLTDEYCAEHGVDILAAMVTFTSFARLSTKIISHGNQYDKGLIEVECAYTGQENPRRDWYCTMNNNAHLVGGKSLANCVRHYLGREPSGAHNAEHDAMDCRDIFFAMRGIKL